MDGVGCRSGTSREWLACGDKGRPSFIGDLFSQARASCRGRKTVCHILGGNQLKSYERPEGGGQVMGGLILKLAPKERILINGAVIENGDRRAKISICTPDANILRLKDAIHPEAVNSPISRLCYICQLVLSGDAEKIAATRQVVLGIEQVSRIFLDPDSRNILSHATSAITENDFYRALKHLRLLLPREMRLVSLGET